jgi:hypothetical protein
MIGLVFPHGVFACLVPRSLRFTGKIVFADQGLLDFARPLGIDFLLPSYCSMSAFVTRVTSRGAWAALT